MLNGPSGLTVLNKRGMKTTHSSSRSCRALAGDYHRQSVQNFTCLYLTVLAIWEKVVQ